MLMVLKHSSSTGNTKVGHNLNLFFMKEIYLRLNDRNIIYFINKIQTHDSLDSKEFAFCVNVETIFIRQEKHCTILHFNAFGCRRN